MIFTPSSLRSRTLAALVVGLILVGAFVAVALAAQNQEASASDARSSARAAQLAAEELVTGMLDQETALRGFEATADTAFLQPYAEGRQEVDHARAELGSARDEPGLRPELAATDTAIAQWQSWAETRRAIVASSHRPATDAVSMVEGKSLFDAFRRQQAALDAAADARWAELARAVAFQQQLLLAALLAAGGAGAATLLGLGIFMLREAVKPIDALAATSRRLAMGSQESIPFEDRQDEVGDLSRALAAWTRTRSEVDVFYRVSLDLLCITDLNGRLKDVNQAWETILDWVPDLILGRSFAHFVHPDDREYFHRLMAAIQEHRSMSFEIRMRTPANVHRWFSWMVALTDAGTLCGAGRDITERVRAEIELREVNTELERIDRIKSDFVSTVSHEFRTALTGIQGFSELLRDEELARAEVAEYATDIFEDAKRLNRMITDMLDLDRLESGRVQLNRERFDIHELISSVVARFNQGGGQTSAHRFDLDLPAAAILVDGDRDKLTQVVANLVNNAVKYSPNGGVVRLATAIRDDSVEVSIEDHGLGIPPDALETIFDRYSRVEKGSAAQIKGTGLGLAIVRQIVEMHEGRVWAESTLGEGSTFHFTVPLATLVGAEAADELTAGSGLA